MKIKKLSPLTGITLIIALAVILVWLISMYCITSIRAEYAASKYLNDYSDFASTIASRDLQNAMNEELDLSYENNTEYLMWSAAEEGGKADSFSNFGSPIVSGSSGFIKLPDRDSVYSATAIFDSSGVLLECSWKDYFYFEYMTEEQWLDGEERSNNNARAFFDRDKLSDSARKMLVGGRLTLDAAAMRFTGFFDGVEFTPRKIEYIDDGEFKSALYSKGSGGYTVSGVVVDYDLNWLTIYENPDVSGSGELVTLYSDWFDVCCNSSSPSFTYNGAKYSDAAALISELGSGLAAGRQNMCRYEGSNMLMPSVNYCFSVDGEKYLSQYFDGVDSYGGLDATLHFYTVSVVYCSPWRTAFSELQNVYIVTFLLSAAVVFLGRSLVKRRVAS